MYQRNNYTDINLSSHTRTAWIDSFRRLKSKHRISPMDTKHDLQEPQTPELSDDLSSTTSSVDPSRFRLAANKSLKRAATWLGMASQKFLSVSQPFKSISYEPDLHFVKHQLNYRQYSVDLNRNLPKRIMYCRVMQIINSGSSRDCEYNLEIQFNEMQFASKRGMMRKVEKGLCADRPYEEALVFEIKEPFTLDFIVSARYHTTFIQDGLVKMGLMATKDIGQEPLPVIGRASLKFENRLNVLDQGVSRLRLESTVRGFDLELLIDIKVEELAAATTTSSFLLPHLSPSPYSTVNTIEHDLIEDRQQVSRSLEFCQQGDHLTIYTRSPTYPTWKRFWVVLNNGQLYLYDYDFKTLKDVLYKISLSTLLSVGKPSSEDHDHVGINQKTGMMLHFDRQKTTLSENIKLGDEEDFAGKAFIFADSKENALHWRRTLSAYVDNMEKSEPLETIEGVALRFLW